MAMMNTLQSQVCTILKNQDFQFTTLNRSGRYEGQSYSIIFSSDDFEEIKTIIVFLPKNKGVRLFVTCEFFELEKYRTRALDLANYLNTMTVLPMRFLVQTKNRLALISTPKQKADQELEEHLTSAINNSVGLMRDFYLMMNLVIEDSLSNKDAFQQVVSNNE